MVKDKLEKLIKEIVEKLLNKKIENVSLEHPADFAYGDYSTNIAMVFAKQENIQSKQLANQIKYEINKKLPDYLEKVEVASAGFINFYLSKSFFVDSVKTILKEKDKFGRNKKLKGQKIMVEYTDPNPFKQFHIGHLMSNAIGEVVSRLLEWNGAKVKRVNYQGDIGIHVAKAIWKKLQDENKFFINIKDSAQSYIDGNKAYEESLEHKKEIEEINKKIYDKSDKKINEIYKQGKKISLEYFEEIYKKLGTKFDYYFFESEVQEYGKEIVKDFFKKDIFEESDGAIIFNGEKHNLHTRVFINSKGIPTYEAKELGLAQIKYKKYKYDTSIVVTGNEINEYFKVLLKAMEFIFPILAKKTKHISHGMLRLSSGKMSSRTGDVITGESLINDVEKLALEKIKSSDRQFKTGEEKQIAEMVSIGAIKYSILKQSPGKDIIFDFNKSLSFEGDSGPYLQYSYARALSVIEKAKKEKIKLSFKQSLIDDIELEHLLYIFPEVVKRATIGYAPNYVTTYLIEIARSFNNFYGQYKVVGSSEASYRLIFVIAFAQTIKNGLNILGIKIPEKM